MNPENFSKLREQISLDCFKEDPNCLYDATELNLLITEKTRGHSEAKTQLERAKKRIGEVRKLGERSLFQAITAINQATHKEKDYHLQLVLGILADLIQETDKSLEKSDFDEIPW